MAATVLNFILENANPNPPDGERLTGRKRKTHQEAVAETVAAAAIVSAVLETEDPSHTDAGPRTKKHEISHGTPVQIMPERPPARMDLPIRPQTEEAPHDDRILQMFRSLSISPERSSSEPPPVIVRPTPIRPTPRTTAPVPVRFAPSGVLGMDQTK
jgi:hypothetical protein